MERFDRVHESNYDVLLRLIRIKETGQEFVTSTGNMLSAKILDSLEPE